MSLAIESVAGYPAWLHRVIPHPVVWTGTAVNALERRWNDPGLPFSVRRLLGCLAMVLIVSVAVLAGWGAERIVTGQAASMLLVALLGTVGLAQRSLFQHLRDVLTPLRADDLAAARVRVSMIVGRDTQQLDRTGISGAALESLAESFNDGIVAPVFWFLIAGLPGLFAYKTLNTADSLIGHREIRWRAFGWAAARGDDLLNLVPARLAGVLLVLAGRGGLRVMLSQASRHSSPNAGWPEAAMAGALGVRLGGPATYEGVLHERPVFGSGPGPGPAELERGLRIYVIACGLLWALVTITGVAAAVLRSWWTQ